MSVIVRQPVAREGLLGVADFTYLPADGQIENGSVCSSYLYLRRHGGLPVKVTVSIQGVATKYEVPSDGTTTKIRIESEGMVTIVGDVFAEAIQIWRKL